MLTDADIETFVRVASRTIIAQNRVDQVLIVTRRLYASLSDYLLAHYDVLGGNLGYYGDGLIINRCPLKVGDMGEVGGFLDAIAEAPDDDLLRLQFADWLDDRGEDWGRLIREQVNGPTAALDSTQPAR